MVCPKVTTAIVKPPISYGPLVALLECWSAEYYRHLPLVLPETDYNEKPARLAPEPVSQRQLSALLREKPKTVQPPHLPFRQVGALVFDKQFDPIRIRGDGSFDVTLSQHQAGNGFPKM